jgi:putative transposase
VLLTFKTKINPNKEQVEIINNISNESRILYNFYLNEIKTYYETENKFISYYEQQNKLKEYKTNYITFDVKKEVLRLLHNNYKSFFELIKRNKDLKPQTPKFRGKNYFFTISFTQDFIIKGNKLIISYVNKNRLEIPLEYNEPIKNLICIRNKSKSDIKQLKIYKNKNEYFVSITYEKKEENIKENSQILSIDLGKKNLVSIYDPENKAGMIFSSKFLSMNQKYFDKRIDELKSKRDKKKKGSIRYKKLNNKINKLYLKKKTQTNLSLQKLSKDLSNQNKTILIGELTNLKKNTLNDIKKINRQMQGNWNLMTFIRLLDYKCKLKGNKVIKVNEAWTSKTCCKCGEINHDLSLNDRSYICSCGNNLDRDINGAINIYKQYMGDYNTPNDIQISYRFDWCNTNQTNKFKF